MLKYGKRILTVLLALVLAAGFCGLLTTPAQAAQSSKVVSQQVSLGDDLTMNFVVSVASDNQDGTLTVSVAGQEVGSYAISSMTPDENGDYRVSAELAAAQMTDTVNLTLTDGDTVFSKDYSVRDYALALLNEANGFSDPVKTMAKAMLNYGAAAQVYFEHNTGKLANDGYVTENNVDLSTVEAPAVETSGKVEGLAFYGASLVFRGKVAVRYYFEAPNGVADFTFSVDGVPYEAKEKGDYYYIEIPGITPENYGKAVTVTAGTVDNTISVSYSPMTYLVRMYGKTGNENLKALTQTMYSYHTSAVEYIAQTEQDSEVELPYSPVFYSMYQYEEFIGNLNPVSLGTLFGTYDEVNENAVIEVTVENLSGTASGVYTAEYGAAGWASNTIQFSGTGKVKITVNNASVELTVENTSYSYPYNHNEPQFYSMVNSEYRYIGNSTVSLGRLFMLSSTVDEASVITLEVVIPEGSNATVDYPQFKATEWEYTNVTFGGTGVVQLQLNDAYLELEVEDTTLDYPYMHNTPSFQPVDMTKNLIGNATVYLDKLFETYSEVNEASVITVDIQTMSDTVSAEYIPAEKSYDWKGGAIVFSGTGDVQISINGTSLWLTVENTAFDYPYTYNYPVFFSKVADSDHYIGANNEVSLSKLFEADPMFTFNEFSVVDLHVEASEGVTVREIPEFAPADWANVTLWFEGKGAVDITLNSATVHLTVEPNGVDVPYVRPAFSVKEEYADGNYCIGNQGISLGAVFTVDGELADDAVILISLNYADGNVGAITLGGDTAQDWQNYRLPTGNEYLGKVTITVNGASIELTVEDTAYDYPYSYNTPDFTVNVSENDRYIGNQYPVQLQALVSGGTVDEFSVITVNVETVEGDATGVYTPASSYDEWGYGYITLAGTGKVKITVNNASVELTVEDSDIGTPYNRPDFTCELDTAKTYYIGNETYLALSGIFTCTQSMDYKSVFKVAVTYPDGTPETKYWTNATDNGWESCSVYIGEAAGELKISVNGSEELVLTVEDTDFATPYVRPELPPAIATTGLNIGKDVQVSLNSLYNTDGVDSANAVFEVSIAYGSDTPTTVFAEAHENGEWWNYPLTFTQEGEVTVTVNGKSPITLTVDNSGASVPYLPMAKFDLVFENTEDYLYRVGNANAVKLSSLFTLASGDPANGVTVNVEAVNGANAGGTYTANSDWKQSTIQFTGTGPVMVTINETVLYLEVVDGVNATSATSATSNNVVLLCNASGSFSVSGGYTFYGNGFTVTLPTSSVTNKGNGFVGYVNLYGGHLDTVRIIGPVFPEQYIYRTQAEITDSSDPDYGDGYNMRYFHNSVIINSGSCNITNSYISGGRTALYVKDGGDILIENTTISGGVYANVQVSVADSVVFRDVTTEQTEVADSFGQGKKLIGIGIVIDDADAEIYIEGTLHQNNWITQAQWETLLGNYSSQFPAFFTDSTYECYWHYRDGDTSTKYVDLTLIFACDWNSAKLHDNRTDKTPSYVSTDITIANIGGSVYSVTGAGTLTQEDFSVPTYVHGVPYRVAPGYTFDYKTADNYVEPSEGSNEFCYEDNGIVKISFDEGGSKVWNPAILTVTKGNNTIDYSVSMNGTDYTGKTITFTAVGDYTVVYTYTDPYNYKLDGNGGVVAYDVTYEKTVHITVNVVEAQAKNAEFKMGTNGQAVNKVIIDGSTYLSASGLDNSSWTSGTGLKFPKADSDTSTISFKYSGKTNGSWGSATINGQTFYFPVVAMGTTDSKWKHTGSWYGCFPVFEGAITITDYADGGTAETGTVYNSSTTTMPSNLSALYPQTVFRYQGTQSKVPTTPSKMTKGTYNGKLCYTTQTDLSATNERSEEWNLATYTYTDNKGTTYYWYVAYYCAASTNGGCVTPDTLITLADGTQKEIQHVTYEDELLVWNFYTGKYDTAPSSIVMNHGYDEYTVAKLTFDDGTEINTINGHGFFDVKENKFVILSEHNAADYVGHEFVKADGDGYTTVKLADYSVRTEYTESWSVLTSEYYNCMVEGMWALTPAEVEGSPDYLMPYEIGEDMKYDEAKMQADIEKYGLYAYEDFAQYCTYEQFVAFGLENFQVSVGKGFITWDEILYLLSIHVG